jgi:hypothetical protein
MAHDVRVLKHEDQIEELKQIATAALANCEVSGDSYGSYAPPHEIRNVHLTHAAS